MYKSINGLTPLHLTDALVSACDVHDRYTRLSNSKDVHVPPHKFNIFKRSFIYDSQSITSVLGVSVLRMKTKEWAASLYLPFRTFTWCFRIVSYVLRYVGVYCIISVWLCFCIYCMMWVLFIFRILYWDVFYCAWQGPMEEQSCTECFFFYPVHIYLKK